MIEFLEHPGPFDGPRLLELTTQMLRIRRMEERLLELFGEGKLQGTTHACIGQESISAGVLAHLRPSDVVVSNHRCHGHYLAHQQDPVGLMAELMGLEDGVCRGWGGSQHMHRGNFYSNGVLGGTLSAAVGFALAEQRKGSGNLVCVFFGDGALGEGQVYECMNLASLWRLPILFVHENNFFSQSTSSELQLAGSIPARFEAFGIDTRALRSRDPLLIWEAAKAAVASLRGGRGPVALALDTFRLCSHSKSDDGRSLALIEQYRAGEPVAMCLSRLEPEQRTRLEAETTAWLRNAEEQASRSEPPQLKRIPPLPPASPALVPPPAAGERCVQALNRGLRYALAMDPTVVLLGEDLLDPYGGAFKVSKGLSTEFPGQVLATPVSEQAITGLSGGLALRGFKPVLEIMFGDFLTLCLDGLWNYISKYRGMYADQVRCPLVLRTPMGAGRGYGPTHSQSLEKLVMGAPDLRVVAPSRLHDPGALLATAILNDPAPVVFIENKQDYAGKLLEPGDFELRSSLGPYPTLTLSLNAFRRSRAVVVGYGGMAETLLETARQLLIEDEIAVEVMIFAQLCPLDLEPRPLGAEAKTGWSARPEDVPLQAALSRAGGRLVTVEEGIGFAGWGSEVVAACSERGWLQGRSLRVALESTVIPSARSLESQLLPSVASLYRQIRELL